MARRRRNESNLDLFLAAPWWISAVVAIAGFSALQWIIPAMTASSSILKSFGLMVKPFGYFIGAIFGLIALLNFFRQHLVHKDRQSDTTREHVPPPITPGPKPTAWSLDLLRLIEWKRFEELTAAFYREIGLRSETIRCGADGGVDAKLFRGKALEPTAIVQCKAWNSRPVGVKPVRELLGVMTHQKIPEGIFIATGDFTIEAIEFAKSNPLDLISGSTFMTMIQKLPTEAQQRLLIVATEGAFTTPTCPSCGIKMVWRNSERGNFWGCANYPRCKRVFHVATTN